MAFRTDLPPPSWVDFSPESKRGLDLLGLRLPAQAVSTWLLDGVTTISPMLRYVSLRTWLVDRYRSSAVPRPDDVEMFDRFARQAERAFALSNVLVDHSISGVVGVGKAKELLESDSEPIALAKLVEQSAMAAYGGPTQDLRLVFGRGEGAPGLSEERGLPLAQAVDRVFRGTSLGSKISSGETLEQVTRAELAEFGEVAHLLRFASDEREALLDAILPVEPLPGDEERLGTYGVLLFLAEKLGRLPTEKDLFELARDREDDLPAPLVRVRDGWLLYHVRDLLAVLHEAVLQLVVDTVSSSEAGMRPQDTVTQLISDWDLMVDLHTDIGLPGSPSPAPDLPFAEYAHFVRAACSDGLVEMRGFRRWTGPFHEEALIQAGQAYGTAVAAALPLAWIMAHHRAELGVLERMPGFDLLSTRGASRLGLRQVIFPLLTEFEDEGVPLSQVIAELVRLTAEQHSRIALARLAQDPTRDVAVLLVEPDLWLSPRRYTAGRTASRLSEAIGWLSQLGLVAENGLTPHGSEILDRVISTLAAGPEQ